MQREPELVSTFKVALLGEVNVGKTSIFHRLKTGRFNAQIGPTIGQEMAERDFTVNGETIRVCSTLSTQQQTHFRTV